MCIIHNDEYFEEELNESTQESHLQVEIQA